MVLEQTGRRLATSTDGGDRGVALVGGAVAAAGTAARYLFQMNKRSFRFYKGA
jgi:hypothetical protein